MATDKYNTDGQVQQNGKLDISFYATADGYKATATVGSAKAQQGVLHFTKPNESIVIAKIKGNDLKMLSSDICVWKSQIATSKHKSHLIAIFKSLPFILAMTMLSFGLAK